MKKTLLTCFVLLLALCSFAQEIDYKKIYREDAINNSPYVFEGVIIKESIYIRNNSTVISYIVRVTRILKGKLKLGTVEIVSYSYLLKEGDKERDVFDNKSSQKIGNDTLCIFFCKPAIDLSYDDKYNIDNVENKTVLSGYYNDKNGENQFSMSVGYRYKSAFYGGLEAYFKSRVEVYQYLSTFKDLNIPAEELKEKTVSEPNTDKKRSSSMPHRSKQQSDSILKARDEHYKLYLEKKKETSTRLKAGTTSTDAIFSFSDFNTSISGSTVFFEYDVNISASSDVYLMDALVDIQYASGDALFSSTTEFTPNIVSSGKINVSLYPEFNNTTYSTFDVADRTSGIFYILLTQQLNDPNTGRVLIGSIPKKMCHVKMEVLNKNSNTKIAFNTDKSIVYLHWGFYSNNINDDYMSHIVFKNCIYNNPSDNVPLCPLPQITSILPSTDLIAGRDQIITITGTNFGKTRANGYVSFSSADDASGIIINDLDNYDYQINADNTESWTDTEIKIKLPSRIYKNNLQNTVKVIGSGPLMVTNNWGDSQTSNITISHNYTTALGSLSGKKFLTYLKDGSLKFRYGINVSDEAKVLIKRALDEWSCRLNVSLQIDPTSSNVIDFISSSGAMVTIPSWAPLTDVAILNGSSININPVYTWSYKLPGTDIPYGQQDFYQLILHELGHALLLAHVNINPSLMYFDGNNAKGQTANNRIDLRNSLNTVSDAQFIATESQKKSLLSAKSVLDICPGNPLTPTNTHGSATSSWQINIAWTDNSNNETGFVIERSLSGANTFTQVGTVNANNTSYEDYTVLPSKSYDYRVYSTNDYGSSTKSNVATITTPAATLPSQPTVPHGSVSSPNSILIQWADNSTNETGYIIERSSSATSGFTQIGTVGSNVTTYTDATITQGISYYYRVKAYNPSGSSSYSDVILISACLYSNNYSLPTKSTITGTYASGSNTTLQALTIQSSGNAIILSGAVLNAEALQTISFTPGFSIKEGATMSAHIIPACGTTKSGLDDNTAIVKGVELQTESKIAIFPNPTKGLITVQIKDESFKFELYNTQGAMVKKDEATNQAKIDLSNFGTGTFFLKVTTSNNAQQTFTILKE